MNQGGAARNAPWGDLGRRVLRCGRCVIVAAFLSGALLAVAVVSALVGEPATTTRITLRMPCSEVNSATVGHSGYGMDEVLSTSCAPPPGNR